MLQSIEIENFRCFEKTAISGFEQINLITGKNNSGKTALLEALFLGCFPTGTGLVTLQKNARELEHEGVAYNDSKRHWLSLFYQLKDSSSINISLVDSEKGKSYTAISLQISIETGNNQTPTTTTTAIPKYKLISKYGWENQEAFNSEASIGNNQINGNWGRPLKQLDMWHPNSKISTNELASIYSQAKERNEHGIFLDAARLIEPTIEEIDVFAIASATLNLKSKHQPWMSIKLYGDAIYKVFGIVAHCYKREYEILLIDEIENGIHYTAQAEVWRMLMKLCKHYNIQLFATTHSLEMIKAFQQVCSEEEFTGMGGYFELGRSPRSQQIIGVKHNIDTLEYELATEATIRGE